MSIVLGLSGKKRAGKDTVCSVLQDTEHVHGMTVRRVAFADPLKAEVFQIVLGPLGLYKSLTENLEEGDRHKNRRLWQYWGTEVRRQMTEDNVDERCAELNLILKEDYGLEVGDQYFKQFVPHLRSYDAYWVDLARDNIRRLLAADPENNTLVVLTDVRFPNEAHMVTDELGGYMWKINRPQASVGESVGQNHASETSMDSYNFFLELENNLSHQVLSDRTLYALGLTVGCEENFYCEL